MVAERRYYIGVSEEMYTLLNRCKLEMKIREPRKRASVFKASKLIGQKIQVEKLL